MFIYATDFELFSCSFMQLILRKYIQKRAIFKVYSLIILSELSFLGNEWGKSLLNSVAFEFPQVGTLPKSGYKRCLSWCYRLYDLPKRK